MSGFKLSVLLVSVVLISCGVALSDHAEIQTKERGFALPATQRSLVLLKNNLSILPVTDLAHIKNVVFVSDANNIDIERGSRVTSSSNSIQESVQTLLGRAVNYYTVNKTRNNLPHAGLTGSNTLLIAVIAEQPDIDPSELELPFSAAEQKVIASLRNRGVKTITIVFTNGPEITSDPTADNRHSFPLNNSDVVIAAFLPGSPAGQVIADAIFGRYLFESGA